MEGIHKIISVVGPISSLGLAIYAALKFATEKEDEGAIALLWAIWVLLIIKW